MGLGRKRRSKRRWVLRSISFGLLAIAAWSAWEFLTWPAVADLAREDPATTAFIERYRQRRRGEGRDDRVEWRIVPYDLISNELKRAVVAAEDVGFFSHRGFDFGEMRAALADAIEDREVPRGASTITQQLAKNLWLSPSRNPLRKVREAILTWHLERALRKSRILELYLNVAEFGTGIYGAEAAARHYFDKPAADLSRNEAARLAASLPRPGTWHPGSSSRAYTRHVETVEQRMEKVPFPDRQP